VVPLPLVSVVFVGDIREEDSMLLVYAPPVGGGTYHLDRRVFPCRFWSRKKRIILAERIDIWN